MGPPLHVQATSPTAEATDAPLDGVIRIRFDRFLDPSTAVRQSLLLTAGTFDATGNPVAGEIFTEPTYDLLERVLVFRSARLLPGVRYTALLRKPSEMSGLGVRAWDGAELESPYLFGFTTTTDTQAPSPEPVLPYAGYCAQCVDDVLVAGAVTNLSTCAFGNCHIASAASGPPLGLDLGSIEGLQQTAFSKPAHQTMRGPRSDALVQSPVFGQNMPNIDPGRPGNSYALYKILIYGGLFDVKASALPGQPVGGPLAPSDEELERLRSAFVMGNAMPYRLTTFKLDQARQLQAWIAAGAKTEATCASVAGCGKIEEPSEPDAGEGGASNGEQSAPSR